MATQKKIGDRYESDSGLGFTITDKDDGGTLVEVERLVRKRDGTKDVETRQRYVPDDVWPFFTLAYKKKRAKR